MRRCTVILGGFLGIDATAWEEGIAGRLFLEGRELRPGVFDASAEARIGELIAGLSSLPGSWAREIALEAMLKG